MKEGETVEKERKIVGNAVECFISAVHFLAEIIGKHVFKLNRFHYRIIFNKLKS